MTSTKPELLLFDLGGVVVEFSGPRDITPLLSQPRSEPEIQDAFHRSEVLRQFETGSLTPEQFAADFINEWSLTIEPVVFLDHFQSWTNGFLPGARELLAELGSQHRLAALSNSNQLHWARNQKLGVPAYFERAFSSHEMGFCKPDPRAYLHALQELDVRPECALFFDDTPANVAGAKDAGLRSYQVRGVAELHTCLVEQGLL